MRRTPRRQFPRSSFYMRLLWLTLFASVTSTACAQQSTKATTPAPAAQSIPEYNGVLVLTELTFPTAAHAYDPLFVLFDTFPRPGSLILRRRFADAAQALRMYDWNASATLRFASLDVSQLNNTLPYELKVLGLPALLLFHCLSASPVATDQSTINGTLATCAATQGGVEVYKGGRTSMEFQRFALGQPLREVLHISSKAELDAIVQTRLFVALFIVDGDDSQAFLDCRVLAQIDSDTSAYVVTTDEFILAENGQVHTNPSQTPSLVLFRQFGYNRVVYNGNWSKAALLQFIQRNRYNLISTYTASDAEYFFDRAAVGHVLLFSNPLESYHETFVAQVEDVATKYYVAGNNPGRHVLRFLVVSKDQTTLLNALFVLNDQFPTVLVVRDVAQAPVRMSFVADVTLDLIQNRTIAQAISDELAHVFSPFTTDDLSDDGDDIPEKLVDWRDYSDLFDTKHVPVTMRVTAPSLEDSVSSVSPGNEGQSFSEAILRRLEVSVENSATTASMDPILSMVTPRTSAIATQKVEVLDLAQLQALLAQQAVPHRVLVTLHSTLCYACGQAMDVLETLPMTSGLDAIAFVDVDRVDTRDWPLHFQWLPGIFLFEGLNQVAMFPSRTAVTVDALLEFVGRAASDASHTSRIV